MATPPSSGNISVPNLVPGQKIAGRYVVVSLIGSGGMGDVYEVEHTLLGKKFAIKRLPVDTARDTATVERFLREARAAAATGHPGVVDVVDVGFAEDGMPYLVMERLTGETLRHRLDRGPLDQATLVRLAHGVLDALDAVHSASIVHRDIKPENLWLCSDGTLKILDFGLSHDTALDVRLTQSGAVMGTPMYMAPEQARGEAIDQRTDLYAVGTVLYECACGVPPFAAPAYSVLVAMILEVQPDRARLSALPAELRDLIIESLAKRPADRPATAAAMRDRLGPLPTDGRWGTAPDRSSPNLLTAPTVESSPRRPEAPTRNLKPQPAPPASAPAPAPAPAPPISRRRRWLLPLIAAGATLFAIVLGIRVLTRSDDRPAASPPPSPPISVTSTRRLTLDMGCEEYPRFSPDSTRIIYDGLIDNDYELLSIALDGTDRRQLTHSPGWDYAAALSPDGRRIAYIHDDTSGRTLRILATDATGAPSAPAIDLAPTSGYPAWTTDGALLVGDATGRILRWDLAEPPGSEIVRETVLGQLPAGSRPYHLADIDGAGVAVLWWTSSEVDATALGELDRDGKLRIIEETSTDYEGGLAASPSRPGYYFTRKGATTGNQLWWRRWGGGAAETVPGGLSPRAGVQVSRDGHRLVLSTCTEKPYVARLRPGATPQVVSRGEWYDGAPVGIDAHRLLITSDRAGDQQGWLIDLASGAARPITPANSHGTTPSRDGTRVAYAADGGRGGIAVAPIDGGASSAVTRDPSDTAPAFSRDGTQLVFARTAAGRPSHLHVVPVDGGASRALTAGAQPATSPVDDTVAFVTAADASGARQVMLIDLSGGAPRSVPGLTAAAWQQPRFSADGKRLLLIRGQQQLVEVPIDGSAPPTVLWTAGAESVLAADWAPDGDGVIAALGEYSGDVWLAEGQFP